MAKRLKAWVITADMGYGHARAAYPFTDIANERIITANSDKIISVTEQLSWRRMQFFYDTLSRLQQLPIIGKFFFGILEFLESIQPLHPYRNLSPMTIPAYMTQFEINAGLCQSVIEYTKKEELPYITTFFLTALAAQKHGIKNVYCIATDTDVSRVWVCANPSKNTIHYFAPTEHTVKRLEAYGVANTHIHLTGFPLPKELVGKSDETAAKIFKERLAVLDYKKQYSDMYSQKAKRPLTIMYAIGGAGAQTNIAHAVIHSLKPLLWEGHVKLIICCGTRLELAQQFELMVRTLHIQEHVIVQSSITKSDYFKEFSELLKVTDVLWTKPSELSFYGALGLPIIIAPTLGIHEEYNQRWLLQLGAGLIMDVPTSANEWIMEWWQRGLFAKAAVDGFRLGTRNGVYEIEKIIQKITAKE